MNLQDRSHTVPSWQELLALGIAILSILAGFLDLPKPNTTALAAIWLVTGVIFLYLTPKNKQLVSANICIVISGSYLVVSGFWFGVIGFVLGVALAFYIGKK